MTRFKSVLVLTLIVFSFLIGPQKAWSEELNFGDTDKQLHVLASYSVAMTSTVAFQKMKFSFWESVLYGSLVGGAVGTAKELSDTSYSNADQAANLVGIGLSFGVNYTFDLAFE